jgi:UPF0716 protein FxsA
MRRPQIGTLLLVWLICEALAFAAVVHALGVGAAILIGLATSLVGALALRGLGRTAVAALRGGLGTGREVKLLDGGLAALGAALLLLPGFLSDLVGLALLAPSIRTRVAARAARPKPTGVVELDPGEWRRLDETR